MKVSELMEHLNTFKEEHGDLPVVLYVDHGQTHFKVSCITKGYTEDISQYMSESIHEDDVEETHQKVCELSG